MKTNICTPQHKKMKKKVIPDLQQDPKQGLAEAFLSLKNIEECYAFFSDLFTAKEIEELSARLQVAKLLHDRVNYIEIGEMTGASTATISRVSKCLTGSAGGYRMVISRSALADVDGDVLKLDHLTDDEIAAIKKLVDCLHARCNFN